MEKISVTKMKKREVKRDREKRDRRIKGWNSIISKMENGHKDLLTDKFGNKTRENRNTKE